MCQSPGTVKSTWLEEPESLDCQLKKYAVEVEQIQLQGVRVWVRFVLLFLVNRDLIFPYLCHNSQLCSLYTTPKYTSPGIKTMVMWQWLNICVWSWIALRLTWVFLIGDGLALCGDRVLEDVHSILYSLPVKTNLQRVDAGWHILGQQVTWLGPHPLNKGGDLLLTQTFREKKWKAASVLQKSLHRLDIQTYCLYPQVELPTVPIPMTHLCSSGIPTSHLKGIARALAHSDVKGMPGISDR